VDDALTRLQLAPLMKTLRSLRCVEVLARMDVGYL